MGRIIRKSILTALFIIMSGVVVFLPLSKAGAEVETPTASGTCGDNLNWGYYADTSTLIITGTGAMSDYNSISSGPWKDYKSGILYIIVQDEVTNIGNYAFKSYTNLVSVTLPNSVTSVGKGSFYNCSSITDVYFYGSEAEWALININTNSSAFSYTDGNKYFKNATRHYPVSVDRLDPTCIDSGMEAYSYWSETNPTEYIVEPVVIDALGHVPAEPVIENEVAVTCTEDGQYDSVVYCSVCGEELSRDSVVLSKSGHNYQITDSQPCSCTEDGYDVFCCVNCDDTYTEIREATGHHYYTSDYSEPTCTQDGYRQLICCDCGETTIETLPARGHFLDFVDYVYPTCTESGYDLYVCEVCGEEIQEINREPLGHHYEWYSNVQPTCTEEGYDTYRCSRCGDERTEIIECTGHNYELIKSGPYYEHNFTILTLSESCSACGDRNGHNLTIRIRNEIVDCDVELVLQSLPQEERSEYLSNYLCEMDGDKYYFGIVESTTGYYDNSIQKVMYEIHLYSNKLSDFNYTFYVPEIMHPFEEIRQEPTCTEDGYTYIHCPICGLENEPQVLPATGHNYQLTSVIQPDEDDEIKTGHFVCTCSNCNNEYTATVSVRPFTCLENPEDAVTVDDPDNVIRYVIGEDPWRVGGGYGFRFIYPNIDNLGNENYTFLDIDTQPVHELSYVEIEPTCTTAGYYMERCSACGFEHRDLNLIPPTGHNYITRGESSDVGNTIHYRTYCTKCGHIQSESDEIKGTNTITLAQLIQRIIDLIFGRLRAFRIKMY